jgi:hypothetical protein
MAYKIIQPENIDIYESGTTQQVKRTKIPFSLDNINITVDELKYYGLRCGVGLLILWFGVTNAGSYYLPATRLMNEPATFFYSWQIANLLIISGALIIYHYLFGSGKK